MLDLSALRVYLIFLHSIWDIPRTDFGKEYYSAYKSFCVSQRPPAVLPSTILLVAYSTHFYPILAFYSLHNQFYPLFGVGHHLLAHKYGACPPRVTRDGEYKPRFQFKDLRDLRISTIVRPEERTILDYVCQWRNTNSLTTSLPTSRPHALILPC